jgi:hypothetical protein
MPAPKWTTPEQEEFLIGENDTWLIVKAGPGTLKNFYLRTLHTFLEKWPAIPDDAILKKAGGDPVKAEQIAVDRLHDVSVRVLFRQMNSLIYLVAHPQLV